MSGNYNLHTIKHNDLPVHETATNSAIDDDDSPDIEFGLYSIQSLYSEIREHLNMDSLDPPEDWQLLTESVPKTT